MIDLKIKITGIGCWDEETPLELSLEDARKLYEELGKVFTEYKTLVAACMHGDIMASRKTASEMFTTIKDMP